VPSECLELPRPVRLLRTAGWNLAESSGLPTGAYVIAASLGGRDAGLWAMLAAIGNLLIFLLHFPLANLGLCFLFARTARCPAVHRLPMNRFFRHVTVLWAGVFLALAVSLGALDRGVNRVAPVRRPRARHRIPVRARARAGLIWASLPTGVTTAPFGIFI
jgi:hypothetical protein